MFESSRAHHLKLSSRVRSLRVEVRGIRARTCASRIALRRWRTITTPRTKWQISLTSSGGASSEYRPPHWAHRRQMTPRHGAREVPLFSGTCVHWAMADPGSKPHESRSIGDPPSAAPFSRNWLGFFESARRAVCPAALCARIANISRVFRELSCATLAVYHAHS